MAEQEASGDFDYRRDDPDADESDHPLRDPDDDLLDDPDDSPWSDDQGVWDYRHAATGDDDRYDAFSMRGWNFRPVPPPWYGTKRAVAALIAVGVAAAVIVVSIVLLLLGASPAASTVDERTTATPTASSSLAPALSRTGLPSPPSREEAPAPSPRSGGFR